MIKNRSTVLCLLYANQGAGFFKSFSLNQRKMCRHTQLLHFNQASVELHLLCEKINPYYTDPVMCLRFNPSCTARNNDSLEKVFGMVPVQSHFITLCKNKNASLQRFCFNLESTCIYITCLFLQPEMAFIVAFIFYKKLALPLCLKPSLGLQTMGFACF